MTLLTWQTFSLSFNQIYTTPCAQVNRVILSGFSARITSPSPSCKPVEVISPSWFKWDVIGFSTRGKFELLNWIERKLFGNRMNGMLLKRLLHNKYWHACCHLIRPVFQKTQLTYLVLSLSKYCRTTVFLLPHIDTNRRLTSLSTLTSFRSMEKYVVFLAWTDKTKNTVILQY